MPDRLSRVHQASSGGAMNSNGTSTRLASLAAAPTCWISRVANSAGGGGSSASGYRPKSGSSQASAAAPSQVRWSQ